MARFKLPDLPDEVSLPVEESPLPIQKSIHWFASAFGIELGAHKRISHMNGKPFEDCTKEDVLPDKVNILQVEDIDVIETAPHVPPALIHYDYNLTKETMKFAKKSTSSRDIERFIKIIEAVHKVPGKLRQFIALYAPSLSGKTQLAISLDRFCENPLYFHENSIEPENCPLRACFRLSCDNAFVQKEPAQLINASPIFHGCLIEAVNADYNLLEQNHCKITGKARSQLPAEEVVSVSSIRDTFADSKSRTLAIFADWIRARFNGSEKAAFEGRKILRQTQGPLTFIQFIKEFQTESHGKPLVFVLDEFAIANTEDTILKGKLLFLRDLLRACCFEVILMGTNASAINMDERATLGSHGSGCNIQLWAQVVTNVFTSLPISQFGSSEKVEERSRARGLSLDDIDAIMKWVNEGRCVKPGPMKTLLEELYLLKPAVSPAQVIWDALNSVCDRLTSRKSSSKEFNYLLGQVEAMISTTRFANELEPKYSSNLLNEHYASLATYTEDERVNLFALSRTFREQRIVLTPTSWMTSGSDIQLDGQAVKNEIPKEQRPYVIKGYLDEEYAKAVFSIEPRPSKYVTFFPTSGYPEFESDEIGFLGLFATPYPFRLSNSLPNLMDDPTGMIGFRDIVNREKPGKYLSTRAAFNLTFRYLYGPGQPESNSSTQKAKRVEFFMEIVGSAAMVIASHDSGLGGSTFSNFLPNFINELGWIKLEKVQLSDSSVELLGNFADYVVPFFPMIHKTCSESLRAIPGVNSGTLRMTKDKQMIDFVGFADVLRYPKSGSMAENRVIVSGELENWKDNLCETDILSIIDKELALKESLTFALNCAREDVLAGPGAHFHFIGLSTLANIHESSWSAISKQHPDISVYVASSLSRSHGGTVLYPLIFGTLELDCKITGKQPVTTKVDSKSSSRAREARKLLSSYDLEELVRPNLTDTQEKSALPNQLCPTCIIIIPVERLFNAGHTGTYEAPTESAAKQSKRSRHD